MSPTYGRVAKRGQFLFIDVSEPCLVGMYCKSLSWPPNFFFFISAPALCPWFAHMQYTAFVGFVGREEDCFSECTVSRKLPKSVSFFLL